MARGIWTLIPPGILESEAGCLQDRAAPCCSSGQQSSFWLHLHSGSVIKSIYMTELFAPWPRSAGWWTCVCWEALKKLASHCITLHYCKFRISVCCVSHATPPPLRWIGYRVNVGRWGRERRHTQSKYFQIKLHSCQSWTCMKDMWFKGSLCFLSALPKTWRTSLSSSTMPRRRFFIRQGPCTAQRRRRWALWNPFAFYKKMSVSRPEWSDMFFVAAEALLH